MKLCDACHRHVRPSEGACPFCGRSMRTTGAARLGAVVLLGALEAGCAGRPVEESGGESATLGTTTSGGGSSSVGTTGPTTGEATTIPATTATTSTTSTTLTVTGELTSTGDIDTTDQGCSFYGGCPADFGGGTLECSTFAQDCPDGEKCTPFASEGDGELDSTRCVPIPRDPDQIGQPCTVEGNVGSGLDSCDGGAICWNVDGGTLTGECVAQCGGTPDFPECPADHTCVFFNDVSRVCLPTCDPVAAACEPGEVCTFNGNDFACVGIVGPGAAEFEPCEFLNSCNPGLFCTGSEMASECDAQQVGCCLAFCDVEAPACNGEGAECISVWERGQAPAGLEHVGVCALPP
ncbi:hypothetical protein [Nannocystis pusilla]|uniref:Lipoprotein n=1 Tax=Nannocystis pusilla TaxID=889268 RepID=A0ABS7U4U0_9BACT|nr:hypothetical protein [Nannocystis pusilla]MBZ5715291.1 hypothetical protein [Nannocystis pusilla]